MGFDCTLPKNMLPFVELYYQHDPTLLIQTGCLIQFEQSYVLQLVAIVVGTLTKTFNGAVTPVLHSIIDFSWESLCRLGIKLPVLEKLVATSKKPTLAFEARRGIQEAAKSWRAISDEVDHMKEILASKEEELQNKYNEQGEASKEVQNSQGQLLGDEVGHLRRLVASKEEELQNSVKVFNEKSRQLEEVFHLKWCSLP
ncbi:hypothetical protein TorRG33x02_238990 [Trema orientale]|uniref:Uncharacterized protein n=1 Tax=Trema orientale TaxID=63057 RepID=A0A2P5DXP2_TREOI|nr:hypothetical protein TorRG33x02_238990 [Trema orientale]